MFGSVTVESYEAREKKTSSHTLNNSKCKKKSGQNLTKIKREGKKNQQQILRAKHKPRERV